MLFQGTVSQWQNVQLPLILLDSPTLERFFKISDKNLYNQIRYEQIEVNELIKYKNYELSCHFLIFTP